MTTEYADNDSEFQYEPELSRHAVSMQSRPRNDTSRWTKSNVTNSHKPPLLPLSSENSAPDSSRSLPRMDDEQHHQTHQDALGSDCADQETKFENAVCCTKNKRKQTVHECKRKACTNTN